MTKEVDLKKIVSNLSKLGVTVTLTKSRLEMLKALASPAQTPQSQGWLDNIDHTFETPTIE